MSGPSTGSKRPRALPSATPEEFGRLAPGVQQARNDRAAIILTNQPKWLTSAYAIFFSGGVLVPLDYKLSPAEHWQLLQHSGAKILVTEYPIWRQLAASPARSAPTPVRV